MDQRFEAIVANPPFSANWTPDSIINDDRFAAYGKMAPKSKADFAFVQHMVYQLADNGTMATVLPHGVLFRGAAEGHIRKYLINHLNYLDAVIGLPANIFYGTSIPTCILVLRKNRKAKDPILFIDSSQQFEKVKTKNVLNPEHITKLVSTYSKYRAVIEAPQEKTRNESGLIEDKYAYIATKAEIIENDYNLNIPRYVDTFEEEDPIDLTTVASDLVQLDKDMTATDKTIANFCNELGISSPF